MDRRTFLNALALATASGALATATRAQANGRVVVVGGGFAGATAAKYLKVFSPGLNVTLVEPAERFFSCPLSCRVLLGVMGMRELSQSYESFSGRHGVPWVRDSAVGVNVDRRELQLASGKKLGYDRLIVAPGVDFDYSALPGLQTASEQNRMPHVWKAGAATVDFHRRLLTIRDGDVVAIHVPKAPFRATGAPYERACIIGTLLQERRINAKVLIFDANPDIVTGKALFAKAFAERYKGLIEYVPNATIKAVSAETNSVEFEQIGNVRSTLWNIIPPQRAGAIAMQVGATTEEKRWCSVDFSTYESTLVRGIHVIGDAISGSPGMAKSAHMANQEAKVCAMAVSRLMAGLAPVANPVLISAAYSFVARREAAHFSQMFRLDAAKKLMVPTEGAGSSSAANVLEGIYAMGWLTNILGDTFG